VTLQALFAVIREGVCLTYWSSTKHVCRLKLPSMGSSDIHSRVVVRTAQPYLKFVGICALPALLLALMACSQRPVTPHMEEPFPKQLSKWGLFTASTPQLRPNTGVIPYDLNTPLFSDYASKYRFIWMPGGTAAQYRADDVFEFPVGTILAKTFAFPDASGGRFPGSGSKQRLIETRLLVHAKAGWVALPYIWDSAGHDATLQLVPDPVAIHFIDSAGHPHDFNYVIPNANECHECHDNQKVLLPIGLKARNLNKDFAYAEGSENQLAYLARVGYLQGLPTDSPLPKAARWDDSSAALSDRARAYLDNNCAHCHQPGGQAGYTAVDFRLIQTDLSHQGLCKSPNSAGFVGALRYDVIPGDPAHSILIYRLESVAPKVSMPALGRDVVHGEGVQLLREWITSLPGQCGDTIVNPE
jgi:uncharacterized repeat protein (TIGR03806 family)